MGLGIRRRKRGHVTWQGFAVGGRYGPPDAYVGLEYAALHAVDVNFNDQWQLAGLRFAEERSRLSLALRWRCLRPLFSLAHCFAHVLDAEGRQISSLDHSILDGNPPPVAWRTGDEGLEFRSLELDPVQRHRTTHPDASDESRLPSKYSLRLGLFHPETNLRLPITTSTMEAIDDYTAVVVRANTAPSTAYAFRIEPAPAASCRVSFRDGVELVGWSVTGRDNLIWVRLRWQLAQVPQRELMFFGHAVTIRDPEVGALAWYDQNMAVHGRGSWPRFEQDIVRCLPAGARPAFLRAGVCTLPDLARLEILESSFDVDRDNRCIFIPIDASPTSGR